MLNVTAVRSNNNDVFTLDVDYITKLTDNRWKHEKLQLQGEMDLSVSDTWRKTLDQALDQAKGNNESQIMTSCSTYYIEPDVIS